ncbi:phosphotransferase [Legionella londiniensis]|uniref:Putative aminoglycoside phosphotransferase n=1 Tax=Legionella londiniensis TaxID=45068 RepID=A0A0W0VQU4_9GAMM|nr:phosphotransferase [Legionella londiniensis]KTD22530.1 putative aminoglycoside phosphotransferase [Legionella londiniensis]STX92461.1 aminoglycoside phosphotransferase [Legionella londiniensis]
MGDEAIDVNILAFYESFFQQSIRLEQPLLKYHPSCRLLQFEDGSLWVSKQIKKETWLGQRRKRDIEFSEVVSAIIAQGLKATVTAVRWSHGGVIVPLSREWLILMPYCRGRVLKRWQPLHASRLGCLLAAMHALPLPKKNAKPFPEIKSNLDYPHFIKQLITGCNQHHHYQRDLWVVSHRDFHRRNVLWDEHDMPRLVDWESCGLIHPFVDLIGLAVNCAGIAGSEFKADCFRATLLGYRQGAGDLPDADEQLWQLCFHSWLLWLNYNHASGNLEEAHNTLEAIQRLQNLMPEMQQHYQALS